jgi:hypothetical protein
MKRLLRGRWRWGWGGLAISTLAAATVAAFASGRLVLPDRWNPWAPLWPQETPNLLTRFKLQRLAGDGPACAAALRATPLAYASVPDRPLARGCGWTAAVRVTALPARLGAPLVLSCPAAVSLSMWERHAVQPAAQAAFDAPVVAVEHYGSFACRDIGGASGDGRTGRRSEHATANALDVAGFVLADGRSVRVDTDWARGDGRGRFLRDVHDRACALWDVVLGPDYNAAHRDHFHLDLGPARACR